MTDEQPKTKAKTEEVKVPKEKKTDTQVRTTKQFRLKDNPAPRRYQFIYLKEVFGFLPEVIVVEKVHGQNNRLQVSAIIPPAVLKAMEEEEKNAKAKIAEVEKKQEAKVEEKKV